MKNLFQILTVLTLVAFIAPTIAQAQNDPRAQAQAALQAALPEGVTLQSASLDQIEAALDQVLATLGGDAFADLAGELAAVIADAQPPQANEAATAVIRRVPAARVPGATVSVAANVAATVRGRAGAPSTSSIVTAATNAGQARNVPGVSTAATARAVVAAVPAARAEIQLDLGLADSDFVVAPPVSDIPVEDPDTEIASPS